MKQLCVTFIMLFLLVSFSLYAGGQQEGGEEKTETIDIEFYSLAWQPDEVEKAQELTKQYNADHPNINVKYITGDWDAARELMVTSFVAEEGPDIFHGITSWALEFGTMGYLEPLNDYVPDEMMNDIDERAWFSIEHPYYDELYAIPWCWETQVIFYNKDIYEDAGVNIPPRGEAWTWDQYITEGKKINNPPDIYFFATGMEVSQAAENIISFIWQQGEEVMHPDSSGKWVVTFNDKAKEALRWYKGLIHEHQLMPADVFGLETQDVFDGFNAGSYASFMTGCWARSESYAQAAPFEWGIMPLPYRGSRANITQPQVYFMPKYCENKQETWDFMAFLMNKENMAALTAGDWLFPTRKSSLELEPFSNKENYWDVALSALEHGHPYVAHPAWGEFSQKILGPTMQAMLLGKIGIDEGADKIVKEGNAILKRFEERQ